MTTELDNPLLLFPAEIWLLIAGNSSTKDLRRLVQTSTKLHQVLLSKKEVWMALYRREGKYRDFWVDLPLTTILHGQKYQLAESELHRIISASRLRGGWFR